MASTIFGDKGPCIYLIFREEMNVDAVVSDYSKAKRDLALMTDQLGQARSERDQSRTLVASLEQNVAAFEDNVRILKEQMKAQDDHCDLLKRHLC